VNSRRLDTIPRHKSGKARIATGTAQRVPKSLFYFSDKTGVALKTKRCSRFPSKRSSVFEPAWDKRPDPPGLETWRPGLAICTSAVRRK
jgi:hypothetical protein